MTSAPPTLSTSAASGGVAGAAVVTLTWALGLFHVALPPDVAAAFMVLAAPVVHYLVTREKAPAAPEAVKP